MSSRLPRDPSCAGLFDVPLDCAALVCYHEDDTSVRPEETRKLAGALDRPTVLSKARGGHSLFAAKSAESSEAAALREWLEQRQRELCH